MSLISGQFISDNLLDTSSTVSGMAEIAFDAKFNLCITDLYRELDGCPLIGVGIIL